jgi:hypothetical protein
MPDYMLYVGTHAIDDPTRAGLVFAAARATLAKSQATVALLGDAVYLAIPAIADKTILAGPKRGSVGAMLKEIQNNRDWSSRFELYV